MSELKAYNVVATADVNPEVVDILGCTEWLGYDKDEADKVIAHNKFKRCLAMAKWCNERIARIEKDYAFWRHGKDYASNFYKRWHERWLELAEKFKEA